jgi:hypothetical protein
MENFEYFEKGSGNNIDKLIKEYGDDVCRNVIDKNYINLQTKNYDFGFIHKLPIAIIGQRKKNKPNDFVYSFILCKLYPQFDEIDITLVCSRPNSKDGKKLIELVCEKGRELNYKRLSLLSIGETKLVNWYKSQDFILVSEKHFPNGELKAYSMRKIL